MDEKRTPAAASVGRDNPGTRPSWGGEPGVSPMEAVYGNVHNPNVGAKVIAHVPLDYSVPHVDVVEGLRRYEWHPPEVDQEAWDAELAMLRARATRDRLGTKAKDPVAFEQTVLRIVHEAKAGKGRYEIARDLRRDGVPTATGVKIKRNEPQYGAHKGEPAWRPLTVQSVLDSAAAKRLGWEGTP